LNITELEQNRGRRLIHLEAIRGIAALFVVLGHLGWTFVPVLQTRLNLPVSGRVLLATPLSLVINGGFAVRIFFVLSGFVLSLSYFRRKKVQVVTQAASRRYPRLMLPALGSVMFAWGLLKLGWYWNIEAAALLQQSPADSWLLRWFRFDRSFVDALREGAYGTFFNFNEGATFFNFKPARTLNASLWTMPWELAGSLLVFSLLALFGWLKRRFLIYAIVALAFYAMEWPFLVDFVAGLALCDVFTHYEHADWEKTLSPVWPTAALITGLILGGLLEEWPSTHHGFSSYFISCWPTVPAVLIIGGVIFSSKVQCALEGRTMAFLGKISFPLYLFHLSVICSVGCGLYVWLRRSAMSHAVSAFISSAACISILLLLVWSLYFVLELPSLRFARRMGQWLMRGESAHSTEAITIFSRHRLWTEKL
jgi:peptidoglycan/LPS O-acetylase OafA/YrhL